MSYIYAVVININNFIFYLFQAIILSGAEDREVDKRYLAALAKNGRLPKFANAEKKNQPQEGSPQSSEKDDTDEDYSKDIFLEDKRHLGNFLRVHGKPKFMPSNSYGDSNKDEKRNIASMARLGRLNSVRFARLHPYNVGGKRMGSEETSNNDEDNAISIFEDPDCIETDEVVENTGEDRPIWMQSKRYVAALARSGRLPIWHSQRMWWGSKRDDSRPSWSSSRLEDNRDDNVLNEIPFVAAKNKRCKKAYESQAGKRNIASLARGGKLPYRPTL